VNTTDGPTKLVRQDAILGGLSIGQLRLLTFSKMVNELDSLGGKSGGLPNQGAWVRHSTNDHIILYIIMCTLFSLC